MISPTSHLDSQTSPPFHTQTQRRSSSGEPRQRLRSPKNDQVLLGHAQSQSRAVDSSIAFTSASYDTMPLGNQPSQQWVSELSPTVGNARNHAKPEHHGQKFTNRLTATQELADPSERSAAEKHVPLRDEPVLDVDSTHGHVPLPLSNHPVLNHSAKTDDAQMQSGSWATTVLHESDGVLPLRYPDETPRQDVTDMPHANDRSRSSSASTSIRSQSTSINKFGKAPCNNAVSASHSSLGNRISTFFGQHRSSPNGSRPATSQGLLEPFSGAKPKDSLSAKRNLFGLHASKSRPAPANSAYRATKESHSHSTIRHDQRNEGSTSTAQDSAHLPRYGSPLVGDNRTTSVSTTTTSPASRVYSTSSDYNGESSRIHNAAPVRSSEQRQTHTASSSSQAMQPTSDFSLANTAASVPMHDEKPSSRSRTAWDHWAAPSGTSVYPELKMDREKRFSRVTNPSLSDGRELMGFGGDLGKKRLHARDHNDGMASSSHAELPWSDGTGANAQVPYIIGFEKQVLAFEPLIQDAYFTLSGDRHTFYPEDSPPPRRVLDIGTGTGGWPIAMAQLWPDTTFVGLDIASIQTDLEALAKAERLLRENFSHMAERGSQVDWQDISERVTWHVGDFLQELPFDTGSFDMVHIRFVGLGVPESSWSNLFSEAARVLKRETGVLEIVEMSKILPSATPHSLRASFASLMLSNFIHQYPFIPIRPALAMSAFTVSDALRCVLRRSDISAFDPANVLLQAMGIWVDSALGKGKHGRGRGLGSTGTTKLPGWGEGVMGEHALSQHRQHCPPHVIADGEDDRHLQNNSPHGFSRSTSGLNANGGDVQAEEDEVDLMVWLVRKK